MSGRRNVTGNRRLTVLYDGWPLVYDVDSPAALHLQELLEALPYDVDACLALPGNPKLKNFAPSPKLMVERVNNSPAGRLRWEQFSLPGMVRRSGARLLHTTSLFAPLSCPVPCLSSPADPFCSRQQSDRMFDRLRWAINQGGQANIQAVLWPEDLPDPPGQFTVMHLPPYVHRAFYQPQPKHADFPPDFVLCPGPLGLRDFDLLADACSWASAGLGGDWTLLIGDFSSTGSTSEMDKKFKGLSASWPNAMKLVKLRTPERRAAVFQQARCVLSIGSMLPWGDCYLHTLACGRPVAGEETIWSDARVGQAGFLTKEDDARALGAAVLTLMIEDPVCEQLRQAAKKRSSEWQSQQFTDRLWHIYQQVISANHGG